MKQRGSACGQLAKYRDSPRKTVGSKLRMRFLSPAEVAEMQARVDSHQKGVGDAAVLLHGRRLSLEDMHPVPDKMTARERRRAVRNEVRECEILSARLIASLKKLGSREQ